MGLRGGSKNYNPFDKKLDFRTTNGFFIGYPEKFKGTELCSNHSTRFVEFGNARFISDGDISGVKECVMFSFK